MAPVVIGALTWALYQQRRDMGLVVGSAALYYWSLYGAWYIVVDKTGGFSGQRYQYLERKLFPIALDGNYMLTLGLYAGFIILTQLTLLAMQLSCRPKRGIPRLVLRHGVADSRDRGSRRRRQHVPDRGQTGCRLGSEYFGLQLHPNRDGPVVHAASGVEPDGADSAGDRICDTARRKALAVLRERDVRSNT